MTGPEAGAVLDAFYEWLAQLGPRAPRMPGVVYEHLRALHEATVSDCGHVQGATVRLDDVTRAWAPPSAAGVAVGYSGRHVRRLCTAGAVHHRRASPHVLLVDVDDLRRHATEVRR